MRQDNDQRIAETDPSSGLRTGQATVSNVFESRQSEKVQLAVVVCLPDAQGIPAARLSQAPRTFGKRAFHTPGQAHKSTTFQELLEGADSNLVGSDGESVAWPVAMAGDKGYCADRIDEYWTDLGIAPVISSKENEDRDDRPVEFDREAYRDRNIIERLIGWLKENHRMFSRFEKIARTSVDS